MADCIDAVAIVFKAHGNGEPMPGGVLGVELPGGGVHIKAAARLSGRPLFATKINSNFPRNAASGRPTIQGLLVLMDAVTGEVLATMDSGPVTRLRTAAATAVAADHLAAADASVAAFIGCGAQALDQLRTVHHVRPLDAATAFDLSAEAAERFAALASEELGLPVRVASLADACRQADIVVTCTTSREAFLLPEHVKPGAFVAAVGADNPHKSEITPRLMARSAVVTDVTSQCAAFGDLHHAIEAGLMKPADVRAELGEVVAGRRRGRHDESEIVVFDSTGTPIQDVALAALVWEKRQ